MRMSALWVGRARATRTTGAPAVAREPPARCTPTDARAVTDMHSTRVRTQRRPWHAHRKHECDGQVRVEGARVALVRAGRPGTAMMVAATALLWGRRRGGRVWRGRVRRLELGFLGGAVVDLVLLKLELLHACSAPLRAVCDQVCACHAQCGDAPSPRQGLRRSAP